MRSPDEALVAQFENAVRISIAESKLAGYNPTEFESMLNDRRAFELAIHFFKNGAIQSGLKRLKSMGRLDLAIESIALRPEYVSLFLPAELASARWRLSQV